jgi:hypothetical protein
MLCGRTFSTRKAGTHRCADVVQSVVSREPKVGWSQVVEPVPAGPEATMPLEACLTGVALEPDVGVEASVGSGAGVNVGWSVASRKSSQGGVDHSR